MADRSNPDGEVPTSTSPPTAARQDDDRANHRLRTELTLLIGHAQLVNRRLIGQDDPQRELRGALLALQRAAQHLLRLAEALPPAAPRQADEPTTSQSSADGDG